MSSLIFKKKPIEEFKTLKENNVSNNSVLLLINSNAIQINVVI